MSNEEYFKVSKDTIQLSQNQSAEAGKCGSCKYFERYDNSHPAYNNGNCTFTFPPQVGEKQLMRRQDEDCTDIRYCNDTYSCSLYSSAQKKYAKLTYWNA